jgi:LA2681-like HEPN
MIPIADALKLETLDGLSDLDALDTIGHLIDHADDARDLALAQRSLELADQFAQRDLSAKLLALLDYFRANAWATHYRTRLADRAAVWAWEQPEVEQQIFLLRRALYSDAFPTLHPLHRCQILTNLANQFDTVGRFIEARAMWSEALALEPDFWMARANRGRALMHYANALYDAGHAAVFALRAHHDLMAALVAIDKRPQWGDPSLVGPFAESAANIGRVYDLDAIETSYNPAAPELGTDEPERSYRQWCLAARLFLNPLNDVEKEAIAAQDVMTLPSFTTSIREPPVLIGFFNQLKQEYASARWFLYRGLQQREPHSSDRGVLLYNTLDNPAYGLGVERTKIAFRMAYSIFDKVAFFLNRYLKLGIPEKRVSFRTLWREKEKGPIRDQLDRSENWALRGLFWLSKDLFEESLRETTNPDARLLSELRNHLEHKYVKVHDFVAPTGQTGCASDPFFDDFAYSLSRDQLERSSLKLLKLSRATLIYLSLGMHHEERRRDQNGRSDKISMPMILDTWDDDWKR